MAFVMKFAHIKMRLKMKYNLIPELSHDSSGIFCGYGSVEMTAIVTAIRLILG